MLIEEKPGIREKAITTPKYAQPTSRCRNSREARNDLATERLIPAKEKENQKSKQRVKYRDNLTKGCSFAGDTRVREGGEFNHLQIRSTHTECRDSREARRINLAISTVDLRRKLVTTQTKIHKTMDRKFVAGR